VPASPPAEPARAARADAGSRRAQLAAAWGAGLLVLLPLALVPYPPLVDAPNHLARLYVLSRYDRVPLFQEDLLLDLRPLPNLGIEAIGLPVLALVPDPVVAARVTLVLLAALYVAGCQALGYAILRRPSWRATLASLLLYGSTLLYGFLGYTVGVGVFLLALAAWIDSRSRWTPLRAVLCSGLALAAYFAHLSTLAFLALTVGPLWLWEFAGSWRCAWRRALLAGAPLVAGAAALLAFPPPPGSGPTVWNGPLGKLVLLSGPLRSYSWRFDLLVIALVAATGALVALRAREVRVRWPIASAAAALLAAALATPLVAFGSCAADARYVLPFACLAPFAVEARIAGRARCAALLLAILGLRLAMLMVAWQGLSRQIVEAVALLDLVPPRSRVLVSFLPGAEARSMGVDETKRAYALAHAAAWAALRREDLPTNLFDNPYQTVRFRDPGFGTDGRGGVEDVERLRARSDAAWVYRPPPELRRALEQGFVLRGRSGDVELWQRQEATAASP